MTTIVYDHENKLIACDSRETTAGGFIVTDNATKFDRVNGDMWFICGNKADKELFIDNFEHNKQVPENVSCSGLLVRDKKVYKVCNEEGVYKLDELPSNEGLGSGGWPALCAVDLGHSAEDAVSYAMTRDVFTGGKIYLYDIELGEFI